MLKTMLTLAAVALAAPVKLSVLDFGNAPPAPSICTAIADGSGPATGVYDNASRIVQSYGDVAGARRHISKRQHKLADSGGVPTTTIYTVSCSRSRARLHRSIWCRPLEDVVSLTHLDLGAWPNTTRTTTLNIYDLANSSVLLYTFSGSVGSGATTHTPFDFSSLSSSSGLRIEWLDEAYNVGIDNVTFNVSPVPEPGSWHRCWLAWERWDSRPSDGALSEPAKRFCKPATNRDRLHGAGPRRWAQRLLPSRAASAGCVHSGESTVRTARATLRWWRAARVGSLHRRRREPRPATCATADSPARARRGSAHC